MTASDVDDSCDRPAVVSALKSELKKMKIPLPAAVDQRLDEFACLERPPLVDAPHVVA